MTGKRQHFIPRVLQRAFASHVVRDQAFAWAYRKGAEPFNSNISNIGVEGYFYSENEDPRLDRIITEFEGEFSALIACLRSDPMTASPSSSQIAQLLAHLEVRTRHLRESLLKTGTHLLDELMKFASDEEALGRYLTREMNRDPLFLQDAMASEMQKRGIPIKHLPRIMKMSRPLVKEVLPGQVAMLSALSNRIRAQLPNMLEKAAKSGHIETLVRTLAPKSKVDRFAELHFRVVKTGDVPLPLGDSVVLFHASGARAFKPFYEGEDELIAVFLPLSPCQVLVGSKLPYELDSARLRREIARCSLEYFISGEPPPEHDDLAVLIGENAYLLPEAQARSMIQKYLKV